MYTQINLQSQMNVLVVDEGFNFNSIRNGESQEKFKLVDTLLLTDLHHVSQETLLLLIHSCRNLKSIKVDNCSIIDDSFI